MAALQNTSRRAPVRGCSSNPGIRIDLTPMVDLGFLLITFFMLATLLAKPCVMPVAMPDKTPLPDPPVVSSDQVLTLLLGGNDKVYWYEGVTNAHLDSTDYAAGGLRKVLLEKKSRVRRMFGDKEQGGNKQVSRLTVIIKAGPEARYKNVVDVFDEMKICYIAHYVMLDISPQETAFMRNPAAGLQFSEAQQIAAAYRK